ncbi:FAD-binding oxidoreductase [Undibacterium sp. SXout7W]|uniref:FAD-binding oxidoreductase n=1 Tax=Undibacterium sp. SXout7W TaxID=3413049 RepID=UPI003BF306F1
MNEFLESCRHLIGEQYVLTLSEDISTFLTDWRQRASGKALAVLLPASTSEVAALVRLCKQFAVPIVPQGGNTGLVLGSIPDSSGNAVLMSLRRLNLVRDIDHANNTITVEAGCLLQQVQQAASNANRLYPLSLASEGSCTVGGNLSTNAGGTAVLRYGNARELCLGIEVVTASGDIWDGLRGLRKDNTGYDLRDLFIGAEGTLGIITAAVLKLYPEPKAKITAFVSLSTPDAALQLLSLTQEKLGSTLTCFELMSHACLQLVSKHFTQCTSPFASPDAQYVLLELSDHESEDHAAKLMEQVLKSALEKNYINDAVIATSLAQASALWSLRENISAAQATEGKNIKHDISVPVSQIPAFIADTDDLLQRDFNGCRIVCFGHMGDGNLHYNVSPPTDMSDIQFLEHQTAINRIVHDNVHRFHGSISAEHGLGALKRDEIKRYKSAIELDLMRTLKHALDPGNLMNPGKLI